MIDYRELRIGNLINCFDIETDAWCIDSVGRLDKYIYTKDEIEANAEANADYEGIPIMEELMLRFGFERINLDFSVVYNKKFANGNIQVWLDGDCRLWNGFNDWQQHYSDLPCKIIHIHQLQNVYFALTGTELIYK